jgi:uncharacterized protein YhfF
MTIKIAVTRAAANTATGTQDFTSDDLGGLTPKAAIFLVTGGIADGTVADGLRFSFGVTSGTSQWFIHSISRHGLASSSVGYVGGNDAVIHMRLASDIATAEASAAFDSFITDGVRINWTDAPDSAYLVTVILLAGDDLSAFAGVGDFSDAQDGAQAVTATSFTPDLVIFGNRGGGLGSTSGATAGIFNIGAAHNGVGITQRGASMKERGSRPNMELYGHVSDLYAMMELNQDGTISYAGEVTAFDTNGFTVTTRVGSAGGADKYGYLALKFANHSSWVGSVDTPTSTGNNAQTGPGFKPQFLMQFLTAFIAFNSGTNTDTAGAYGISVVDQDEAYSNTVAGDDGAADSDTQSLSDDVPINMDDATGTDMFAATFVSFDTNGWTLNFSDTDATVRKWWALAVEEDSAGGTTYEKTGSGVAAGVGSGADVDQATEIVQGTAAFVGSGSDVAELNRAGSGVMAAQGSGSDIHEATEAVTGTGALVGSGLRALVFTKAGGASSGLEGTGADASTFTEAITGPAALEGSGADVTEFTEAGQGEATLAGSGSDEDTLNRIGQGTASLEGVGTRALLFTKTGGAEASLQGSGADVATYTESGDGLAAFVGSGADEVTLNRTGQGTAAFDSSSIDFVSYVKQGQGTAAFDGGGADITEHVEAATAAAGLDASGSDVATFSEVGAGVAALEGSGSSSSAATHEKAGQGEASLAGSGADVSQSTEIGSGEASLVSSGEYSLVFTKTGGATLSIEGSGVDASTFTEAGQAEIASIGSGAKSIEFVETGSGIAILVGSGTPQVEYTETGVGTGAFVGSGLSIYEPTVTLTQTAYRFRYDNGDEDEATWIENENDPASIPVLTNFRLRVQIDASGDPDPSDFQLEYRPVGGDWAKVN